MTLHSHDSITRLLAENGGIKLDIGCGSNRQPGFVGLDIRSLPGVDLVWDFEALPWPLPDECVLIAMASHVVEHINPHKFGFINFMDEVWRVCKPEATFVIATPYWLSKGFAQDPTHCNPCNEATWAYFCPDVLDGELYAIYEPKPWVLHNLFWDPSGNMEVILKKPAKTTNTYPAGVQGVVTTNGVQ